MMVIQFANRQDDSQQILKPLVLSFLMQIARQYALVNQKFISESTFR